MKKLFTILAVVLLNASSFAQSPPQKMSYQAIIRNSSNALVTSTSVGMQISILQASPMGGTTPVYVETQTPTTNINGLVSIEVGAGTVISGIFSAISWANGPFYIKTETDLGGGTNYSITGTSQLLSVPYALYAAKSGSGESWILNGNGGSISDANFIGTTTNIPFNIKVNNQKSGRIDHLKQNTFFGYLTGSGTSGTNNTAVGYEALYSNTTGSYNTASGINALYFNTSGNNNTAYGYDALNFNTIGTYNTALGQQALFHNTTGTNNTAVGLSALGYNTTGGNSTAIGTSALLNSTGDENVAVGFNALFSNTTGTKNTALGTNAYMTGTLTNTTIIGYGATATLSNIIQLGNTSVTDVHTAGTYTAGAVTYPNTLGTAGQVLTLPMAGGIAYWATPASGSSTHYLGEAFNGGIIYYLYKGNDGLEHGLIVALTESTAISWQTTGTLLNANRSEDGAYNTGLMTGAGSPAATYIATLGAGWYLPSIDELALLYYNRYSAQKGLRAGASTLLNAPYYWSSTEENASNAYAFCFNSGYSGANGSTGKLATFTVRAIRSF